jgi:hypothetical protein
MRYADALTQVVPQCISYVMHRKKFFVMPLWVACTCINVHSNKSRPYPFAACSAYKRTITNAEINDKIWTMHTHFVDEQGRHVVACVVPTEVV